MARDDWQDREDERRRAALRSREWEERSRDSEFANDRDAMDRRSFRGYDADDAEYARRMNQDHDRTLGPPRSWLDRAGAFFAGGERTYVDAPVRRRRGPSDRVLWAVIVERLEHERGLDLRDVEVIVDDAEVTLNGRVRHKADRRRIEDVADIEGVRHVQNNLRVHESHWIFF